jgi:hypothetical protein
MHQVLHRWGGAEANHFRVDRYQRIAGRCLNAVIAEKTRVTKANTAIEAMAPFDLLALERFSLVALAFARALAFSRQVYCSIAGSHLAHLAHLARRYWLLVLLALERLFRLALMPAAKSGPRTLIIRPLSGYY